MRCSSSHSRSDSAAVRHPWRAAGDQCRAHVFLLHTDRNSEPGTPEKTNEMLLQNTVTRSLADTIFPIPGSAAHDAGEFVLINQPCCWQTDGTHPQPESSQPE